MQDLSSRLELAIAISIVVSGPTFAVEQKFAEHFDCVGAAYWAHLSTAGEDGSLSYVKSACKYFTKENYNDALTLSLYEEISDENSGGVILEKYGTYYLHRIEQISKLAMEIARAKISEIQSRDPASQHNIEREVVKNLSSYK